VIAPNAPPPAAGGDGTPTYGIALLPSTEHALVAEEKLLAAGLKVRLIPVPRSISSECGMAVRFGWPDRDRVEAVLRQTLERFELRALW
jgi:hypothetical protein